MTVTVHLNLLSAQQSCPPLPFPFLLLHLTRVFILNNLIVLLLWTIRR